MASPNLISPNTKYGKTTGTTISTAVTVLVSNPQGSNKVYKINSLYVANIDNSVLARASVDFFRLTTSIRLVDRMEIGAGDTLVAVTQDSTLYLEEGDSLRCYADQNDLIHAVLSYEVIS